MTVSSAWASPGIQIGGGASGTGGTTAASGNGRDRVAQRCGLLGHGLARTAAPIAPMRRRAATGPQRRAEMSSMP